MILSILRMKKKVAELEDRIDVAAEQRVKLTAYVEGLKNKVDNLEEAVLSE